MAESPKGIDTEARLTKEQLFGRDGKVLEETYRHNYKIVRNYIVKNNGTEADARDIFQDAMMITWMNLKEGKFELKNHFALGAYIYKIAKYKWIDTLKSKERKSTIKNEQIEFEDAIAEEADIDSTDKQLHYLTGLYNQLDAKCKEVLNKFYYEKMRLEAIAAEMKYDTGSIRTIKYRCMQKLRKMHDLQQTKMKR